MSAFMLAVWLFVAVVVIGVGAHVIHAILSAYARQAEEHLDGDKSSE